MNCARKLLSLALVCGLVLVTQSDGMLEAQSTQSGASSPAARPAADRPVLWKSQTSGNEYRVSIEGTTLQAEQVNIPKDTLHQGAYVRTTARRQGQKWIGKTQIFLPCALGHGPVINKCHMTMGFEITEMGPDLIHGRIENPDLNHFDCKSCNVPKTEWMDFAWVPKKQ